jgi:hypothetical protein
VPDSVASESTYEWWIGGSANLVVRYSATNLHLVNMMGGSATFGRGVDTLTVGGGNTIIDCGGSTLTNLNCYGGRVRIINCGGIVNCRLLGAVELDASAAAREFTLGSTLLVDSPAATIRINSYVTLATANRNRIGNGAKIV